MEAMRRWLYRVQNKYRNFGIDNLMLYVTVTMLAVYLLQFMMNVNVYQWFSLIRPYVLQGQVWRLITFVFLPGDTRVFWFLLSLYVYYFLGNSLEQYWGKFHFTVYYLFGIVGAIVAGMITGVGSNSYINTSLLLAFAQLFPDQEFLLFFMLPIKVKYIGYVTWALYALGLFAAIIQFQWFSVAAIIASLINFFLFFGPDIIDKFKENRKYAGRRKQFKKDTKNFRDRF